MIYYEYDILKTLKKESFVSQRILSELSGYSLGVVNKSLKAIVQSGLVYDNYLLTDKGNNLIDDRSPKRAVILAAGFGMRMVPINFEQPKGLLEINGERIVERQIRFLKETGINEIYVVVGFMKESFEYLIDKYGVELIVNDEYYLKNNLHSLFLARQYLKNSYIIPSDLWLERNPFDKYELYSWYMVGNLTDDDSQVRVNRKRDLIRTKKNHDGNSMIGISYVTNDKYDRLISNLVLFEKNETYNDSFWEECLYDGDRMFVEARIVDSHDITEINTYEQLRDLDYNSSQLKNNAINIIKDTFGVQNKDITNITVLKKGMTNRSFLFSCLGRKYIMRIPGEGTDKLINRREEASVYKAINGKNISDNLVYFNPSNGYKITEFFEDSRNCDSSNFKEVEQCMGILRKFHDLKLSVSHTFDIYKQIEFYESLWNGAKSVFSDYCETKRKIYELKEYIDKHKKPYSLTHIDAVCDNFLFVKVNGKEEIRLIDWEYAGMQDTDVDLAMNCIYALYNKNQVDKLIDSYYVEGCTKEVRIKIYAYIAVCGLLWSNWCEYKRTLGVEFGEYALRQYRYSKDYYRIVMEELGHGSSR